MATAQSRLPAMISNRFHMILVIVCFSHRESGEERLPGIWQRLVSSDMSFPAAIELGLPGMDHTGM
jgi:hypothetical protein